VEEVHLAETVEVRLDDELAVWLREEADYQGRPVDELIVALVRASRPLDPLWYQLREEAGVPAE